MEPETNPATTPLAEPVPIVLCGKTLETGKRVTRLIQPEFQVIHFINTFEDAKANLPDLIAGRRPKLPSSNHIGTHDYSKPPAAVIFGRAFDPDHVTELNHLCRGAGSVPIAWIAGDPTILPPAHPGTGYAENSAKNVKRAFERWRDAGAKDEEVVFY